MSDEPNDNAELTQRALHDIDEIRDRFEAELIAGTLPKIESFLTGIAAEHRRVAFKELLRLELLYRQNRGQTPTPTDYLQRFPQDAEVITSLLIEMGDASMLATADGTDSTIQLVPCKNDTEDGFATNIGSRVGRYRIVRLLGEGGFGRVFLALDEQLQREVALKVPRRADVDSDEATAAYLAEARTLAELDSPHIVPVFDVGSTEECPVFIVSKLINGVTLQARMAQGQLPVHETARIVATIADGLHYAHGRKIVHRDMKPGNILLDMDSRPFITDFGLALKEADYGKQSNLIGTPAYMSPEQVEGKANLVDGRSDVFSLGVVMYEMLTGERPFGGQHWTEVIERIAHVDARPPRQLNDKIPVELERICLKALRKRPDERYTTARDMAEDLRQFLRKDELPQNVATTSKVSRTRPTVDDIKNCDTYLACASLDDQPLEELEEGWVSRLQRNLKVRLEQLLGESVSVVSSPMSAGRAVADQDVIESVASAKTMVSVLSPPFAQSEDCHRSVTTYWNAVRRSDGQFPRLLKAVRMPIADGKLPHELCEIFSQVPGFEFFQQEPEGERIREFHDRFGPEARQRYYERVYDLAHEVSKSLVSLKGALTPAKHATGRTVFLAATTSDVRNEADRLRRELQERGYEVLPNHALSTVADELENQVKEGLAQCDFAIHLLGGSYGMIPEGANHSVVELQNDLAAAHAREAGIGRLIWISHVGVGDDRQASFIGALLEQQDKYFGAEIIRDDLEAFKRLVVQRLSKLSERSRESTTTTSGPPRVYLMCDEKDQDLVEPVEDYLYDSGLEVSLPDFETDQSEATEVHQQHLLDCDGVLIYYGAARQSWVDIKLRSVQKAIGYGRDKPITCCAVLVAPPVDRRKERFKTHLADVVRWTDTPDASLLQHFVTRIKEEHNR